MSTLDLLVVGSGGREHALAWKLRQSPRCGRIFAAPGNPGIAEIAECLPAGVSDLDELVRIAVDRKIGLAVIGPEVPLAAGLADRLRAAGIRVFGPSAAAARIESSKAYARELMQRKRVPQPSFASVTTFERATFVLAQLEKQGAAGVVVKASGLAAGKGAIVCDTFEQAREVARAMLEGGEFGEAGQEVVIEERLVGEEASLFVLTDGVRVAPLLPAQDYKRALDGDEGPNTGGMGAYAPAPLISPALYEQAVETIVRPTLRALREDGAPFSGCLYAGLMKTGSGLRVIEFNCRFGDPETQVVLPLIDEDLLELMLAVAEERLEDHLVPRKPGVGVTVVLASGGYPGSYENGKPIHGLEAAAAREGVQVFHAGTARREGEVVTAGGRVLNVTALGASFAEARERAYGAAELIQFEGKQLRTDIAARVA
ncbi:MAG: phosphoribosylamine--glycine ligase [Armatimonadota bacterium]